MTSSGVDLGASEVAPVEELPVVAEEVALAAEAAPTELPVV